jgi:hypothetical protein
VVADATVRKALIRSITRATNCVHVGECRSCFVVAAFLWAETFRVDRIRVGTRSRVWRLGQFGDRLRILPPWLIVREHFVSRARAVVRPRLSPPGGGWRRPRVSRRSRARRPRRWAEVAPPAPDPTVDARARCQLRARARSRTVSSRAARASSPCRRPPTGKARATRPPCGRLAPRATEASSWARRERTRRPRARVRARASRSSATSPRRMDPRGTSRRSSCSPRSARWRWRCSRRASPASSWPCASSCARAARRPSPAARWRAARIPSTPPARRSRRRSPRRTPCWWTWTRSGAARRRCLRRRRGRLACCSDGSRTCPTPPAGR